MDRRNFLRGLIAAPAVIRTPGLLMPVKSMWTPPATFRHSESEWRTLGHMFAKSIFEEMQRPTAMRIAVENILRQESKMLAHH